MPRLTLLTKFSITSFVLLAAMGALLGNALTRHFEEQAIEQQKAGMSSLIPPVIGSFVTDELLDNGAHGDLYKQIEGTLSYLGGAGLVRVRIVNKAGTVVYADTPDLIGSRVPTDPDFQQAMDGAPTAAFSDVSNSASAEERGYGKLLLVNTPLRKAGKSEVSGVFEGYYDIEDLQQRIDDTAMFLWSAIGAGFLFLYVSLFTIVSNASRRLIQQSKENESLYRETRQRLAEREEAERQTRRQVERLRALRNIDIAISSNLDLRLTLHVILTQVCTQLRVDAASILLVDKQGGTLEYVAGRGFGSADMSRFQTRMGEGYTGLAAQRLSAPEVIRIAKMADPARVRVLSEEGFVSYSVATLVTKGQVKGALEIFHKDKLQPDEEWLQFFTMLAGQTAIAVENATLFDELERSNSELSLAYDSTLEGWAKALDLRDEETEGHSRRVTEMTIRLARSMGVPDADMLQIRRGALLHDIGKMGIPDAILLKPGPLNDDEWRVMRQHPIYAYLLLSPITFLRPALDIPYCHHEKWDGTGYPRGLKGEQIPLAARIFAVVDVWDALGSNRPYRKAMPKETIYAHIKEQSGTHFDPRVVEAFLAMEGEVARQPGQVELEMGMQVAAR